MDSSELFAEMRLRRERRERRQNNEMAVEEKPEAVPVVEVQDTMTENPAEDTADGNVAGPLRPVTVRFSAGAWEAIRDIAAKNGVSQAELVRMAVAGNLEKYLGTIRFLDSDQGNEIKRMMVALMDTMSRIQGELNRIGVNYNQEVRLKQIERKYRDLEMSDSLIGMKAREESDVKKECAGFSRDDLDRLMTRYKIATKEAGVILCRILT